MINSSKNRFEAIRQVTLIGAITNVILTVVKILVGVIGHSQALMADGLHSLADLVADGFVYLANHQSQHGPDEDHPYGHGRFETLATLGLGATLLGVAGFVVWDAGVRLFETNRLLQPDRSVLAVALLALIAKEWMFHYTLRVGRRVRSDMVIANAWHHRSDAWSSLVVLVGVLGTMAGLNYLDAIAAALVGIMIAHMGWEQGWGAIQELVDAGLSPEQVARIRNLVLSVDGVRDLHMLRTRKMGGVASADVHVLVEPRMSVSEGHIISVWVEHRLKAEIDVLTDITVHIDPEDDTLMPPGIGLPARGEAEALLARCWAHLPRPSRLVLHYLAERIEVDAYLRLVNPLSPQEAQELGTALRDAIAGEPAFGAVRLYWESAS
ncbi:MAG: cation diffusion facilitator family transporter [Pseudomonadota bacterium]